MTGKLLAGDVGGTKTTVALYERGELRLPVREETFASAKFDGLEAVLAAFLAGDAPGGIDAACFGIAGPVIDNRCVTPNLPWVVDGAEIVTRHGIARVELVNDLVAMGMGIAALSENDFVKLQAGTPSNAGNAALVAAGTGLGLSVLRVDDAGFSPLPSEGGHADFAPRSDDEVALLRHLRQLYGRVSVERVLSGPGLFNIYAFLRDTGFAPETAAVREAIASGDPGAAIAAAAISGTCPLSAKALDLFLGVYGAVAGNMALLALATQGVYLGGGIAPKLLPQLADGRFLAAFCDKGRLRSLLETVPVRVILEPKTPLLGAARRASALCRL